MTTEPKPKLCDYCSQSNPTYIFKCPSFDVNIELSVEEGLTGKSVSDWLACDECAKLILNNQLSALSLRCLLRMQGYQFAKQAGFDREIRAKIAEWHAEFYKHWTKGGSRFKRI